jgi:hypothetical protein
MVLYKSKEQRDMNEDYEIDSYYEDRIKAMFYEAFAGRDFNTALLIAKYHFDGLGYEQIRSLIRINY